MNENVDREQSPESQETLSPTHQPVPAQPIDGSPDQPEQPNESGMFDKGAKVETDENEADFDAEEQNPKENTE